jgi:predicted ATPase
MATPAFLRVDRLRIENYRSIQSCDFELGAATFLIGKNGAGKTNVVDALAFLQRAVENLEFAFEDRVSARSVVNRSRSLPSQIRFALEFSQDGTHGDYGLRIEVRSDGSFEVIEEFCEIEGDHPGLYTVVGGQAQITEPRPIALATSMLASPDRLFLASASTSPVFRPLYDLLTRMTWVEPAPREVHALVAGTPRTNLLPRRVRLLQEYSEETTAAVYEYLRAILPGFGRLEVEMDESRARVIFIENGNGSREERFRAIEVSGGIVNAVGMLVELFAPSARSSSNGWIFAPLCIEDPEAGLHPFASAVMRDAIRHASTIRQVIVTTHSTELLDDKDVRPEEIRVVHRDTAGTHVDPLDEGAASVLREHLMTAGELLRSGGMGPQLDQHLTGA